MASALLFIFFLGSVGARKRCPALKPQESVTLCPVNDVHTLSSTNILLSHLISSGNNF